MTAGPQIPETPAAATAAMPDAGSVRMDGDKLDAARIRRLLLPREICRLARVSGLTLRRAFAGEPIEAHAAAAIAEAFGVDLAAPLPDGAAGGAMEGVKA